MKKYQQNQFRNRIVIRTLLAFAWALSVFFTASAQVAPQTAGTLIETKIASDSLKNNLLNDSFEQNIAVYLPPSYEASKAKRYPTVYLLHGFNGKIQNWTKNGYQGMSLQTTMDGLIKSGAIREMIVVTPNGTNAYYGSFFTNSIVTGNWEDYVYKDLVSYVDKNYRTLEKAESRGIAGHSMGGYGAIMMGMKHPDIFGAIYGLSPCCLGMDGDMGTDNPAWAKALKITSKEQLKKNPETYDDFYINVFFALSAAFSPNAQNTPFFADFPYKETEGHLTINEPAFSLWRSKMPLYQVEQYRQNLLKLRGIYLDVGQFDDFSHIRIGTRLFSEELAKRGIPHTFEIYKDGDHGNKIRERIETKVFNFFSNNLKFAE